MDENGHGTMMAAIAAGNEVEAENFYGVAPNAQLVVVKLKPAKKYLKDYNSVPDNVVCFQENSIMWGVQYCVQVARQLNRPIAIAIGMGTSQGPHDGSTPSSKLFSALADYQKTAITISGGNEGNFSRHYHGMIDSQTGFDTVELNVGENEGGFSMELWGDAPGIFSIDILSPSGEFIPRIAASLHVNREISFIFESTVINIDYQTAESETGDQLILLRFRNTTAGVWRFRVYGQSDLAIGFHIWLPMGDMISRETYFIRPDIYTTVLGTGTSVIPITVTAYNPLNSTLYSSASRGYTQSGIVKPELAAPGVNYLAPNLNHKYSNYTGSGAAAAHTAGVMAMALEWGIIKGNEPTLDTLEIKKFFIRGAKRNPSLTYPNRDWGYGILDIFNVFDVLRSEIGQ